MSNYHPYAERYDVLRGLPSEGRSEEACQREGCARSDRDG